MWRERAKTVSRKEEEKRVKERGLQPLRRREPLHGSEGRGKRVLSKKEGGKGEKGRPSTDVSLLGPREEKDDGASRLSIAKGGEGRRERYLFFLPLLKRRAAFYGGGRKEGKDEGPSGREGGKGEGGSY